MRRMPNDDVAPANIQGNAGVQGSDALIPPSFYLTDLGVLTRVRAPGANRPLLRGSPRHANSPVSQGFTPYQGSRLCSGPSAHSLRNSDQATSAETAVAGAARGSFCPL